MTTTTTDTAKAQMAAKRRKKQIEDERAAEIRRYQTSGMVVDGAVIETETRPSGDQVLIHATTRRYLAPAGPRSQVAVVVLNDAGDEIEAKYRHLGASEIDRMLQGEDRHASQKRLQDEVAKVWRKAIKKANPTPAVIAGPVRRGHGGPEPFTLDDLDRYAKECGASLKVVRGSAVLVTAPDPAQVQAACDDAAAETTPQAAGILTGKLSRHRNAVRATVRAVDDLGPLAVAYVKDGKRPKADVGTGPANRLLLGGLFGE